MKNQFTPYEISVKLKELGFNEKCFDVYSDVKSVGMFRNSPRDRTPKILWQQAFDWFTEIHNMNGEISLYGTPNGFNFGIYNTKNSNIYEVSDIIGNYEEARLKCLKKLIELVENKKG